jgi:hypothetical protein
MHILTQTSLKQRNEFIKVSALFVVPDKLLQLVSMYDNVQTADLSQAKLQLVHTCEAHLKTKRTLHTKITTNNHN